MNTVSIEDVINEAIKLVTPTREEEEQVLSVANRIIYLLQEELNKKGLSDLKVTLQGSVAKNTWLPGDRDIDVFIVMPREKLDLIKSGGMVNILIDIAMNNNIKWNLKYAQHPYVQYLIDKFEVDVVPCIEIRPNERPFTAADRTPLHTMFVKSRLGANGNTEVRLLKAFFKAVGIYGAEIKVRGFSGYVSELLIIHYGSFINTIKSMSNWPLNNIVIDITGMYDKSTIRRKFKEPLVIIDPVDPNRNAAASVSKSALAMAIASARAFMERPSIEFFKSSHEITEEPLLIVPTLIIKMPYPQGVSPDTVWGELGRVLSIIERNMRKLRFKVYDLRAWSDDSSTILIMLTLESLELTPYELHMGPPVNSEAAYAFLSKYINNNDIIGPFIRGSRWYIIRKRKIINAQDAIKLITKNISVKYLRDSLSHLEFYTINSLTDLSNFDRSLRDVVKAFLIKRPWWINLYKV